MALSPYILWINTEDGTLTAGAGLERTAANPFFIQGDTAQIEIHFLKRLDGLLTETAIDAGSSVRVGVGEREARPTAGTFNLSYGGEATGDIAYNASASTIQTALNALTTVTADGGLTVEAVGDGFLINWNTGNTHTAFTSNTDGLFPKSIAKIVDLNGGTQQTIYLHLAQTPIAFSDNWTQFTTADAYTEIITPYQTSGVAKVVRLGIDGVPSYGYLNLAVYRSDVPTNPMGFVSLELSMSAGEMKAAVAGVIKNTNNVPTPEVLLDVVKVDDYIWDFIFSNNTNILVGSQNIITSKGVHGTLSFNTVECHQFLAGASVKESIFEVMVVGASGEQTMLQIPVLIYSDVIDANALVPLTFDTPLGEATANARFVRKDATQNPSPTELNNIWLNLGVSKLGSDVSGALSSSNGPTSGNPFATLSDLLGLDSNWGSIGGTLSDQTDLQNALDLKSPLLNPAFSANATVAGRVGIGGPVANNAAHKLAIYDGNIVFSAGFGLAFGDGTTQTTAFPGFTGYATESWVTSRGYATETFVTTRGYITNSVIGNFSVSGSGVFDGLQVTGVANIASTNSASAIVRIATGATPSGGLKSIEIGTDGLTGSTTNILIGTGAGGSNNISINGSIVLNGSIVGANQLSGKRIIGVPTGGVAGVNIGIGGLDYNSTTPGDLWIATNGTTLNFRDGQGSWRQVLTTSNSNIIDTSSATVPALRITQRGTGEAFRVEDSTSPDSTPFVINNDGAVGIGVAPGIFKLNVTGSTNITGAATVVGALNAQDQINVGSGGINFVVGGQLRAVTTQPNPNTQGHFDSGIYGSEIILDLGPGVQFAIPARQITQ